MPGAQAGDDYTTSYTGVQTYDDDEGPGGPELDRRLQQHGNREARRAGDLRHELPGRQRRPEARQGRLCRHDTSLTGGYLDSNATPGTALTQQFQFVDDALGKFKAELHGAGPRPIHPDHRQRQAWPVADQSEGPRDHFGRAVSSRTPGFGTNGFEICDDEALVWLSAEMQQATNPATGNPYYAAAKAYMLAQRRRSAHPAIARSH